jgi:hypothetical protein
LSTSDASAISRRKVFGTTHDEKPETEGSNNAFKSGQILESRSEDPSSPALKAVEIGRSRVAKPIAVKIASARREALRMDHRLFLSCPALRLSRILKILERKHACQIAVASCESRDT